MRERQNGAETGRQQIKVASAPFKPDAKTSQNQLIEMPDIMSISELEVQLNFCQDENEDSISPEQSRPQDNVFERQQQTIQDVESVSYSFG